MSGQAARPRTKMTKLSKVIMWYFLVTWVGWIACSSVAVYASPYRPSAGDGGFAILLQVVAVAVTGETPVAWALAGSRVLGVAFLIAIFLVIWRSGRRKPSSREPEAGGASDG